MNKINKLILLVGFVTGLISCSSTPNYKIMNSNAKSLVEQGEDLLQQGKSDEGVKLLMVAQLLHPENAKITDIINKLTPEQKKSLEESPMLGFNKSKRAHVDSSTLEKVAWYIPDRLMDIVDMISIGISIGPQVGAGVWLTREAQLVAYTGSGAGIGFFQKKQLGGIGEASFDAAIGPFSTTALAGARIGTGGVDFTLGTVLYHEPGLPLYQEYRDFWAIGAKLGVIVGIEIEIHPIEMYDFVLGVATFDPMNDDLATTRRLRFDSAQNTLMKQTLYMVTDAGEEGMDEYKKRYPVLEKK